MKGLTHDSWLGLRVEVFPGAKVAGAFVVGGGLVALPVTALIPTFDAFPNKEHLQPIPALPRQHVLSGEYWTKALKSYKKQY